MAEPTKDAAVIAPMPEQARARMPFHARRSVLGIGEAFSGMCPKVDAAMARGPASAALG